ncbi:MAG: sigma-70 family RNA polymerase sigma factor [Thermomicrobiales bacterium]
MPVDTNDTSSNRRRSVPDLSVVSEEPDALLAARVATDPAAFAELYRRYVVRIDQYCSVRLRNETLAQDVTSQVFLKALEGLRRKPVAHVAPWLFTIAHNEVVNCFRQHAGHMPIEDAGPLASTDLSPEEHALLQDESADLRTLLQYLSPDQQRIVELRIAGLTAQEIQDVLGRSRSWVGTTQHRALRRLRGLIEASRMKEGAR